MWVLLHILRFKSVENWFLFKYPRYFIDAREGVERVNVSLPYGIFCKLYSHEEIIISNIEFAIKAFRESAHNFKYFMLIIWIFAAIESIFVRMWQRTRATARARDVERKYVCIFVCIFMHWFCLTTQYSISTLRITIYGDWIVRRNDKLNDE